MGLSRAGFLPFFSIMCAIVRFQSSSPFFGSSRPLPVRARQERLKMQIVPNRFSNTAQQSLFINPAAETVESMLATLAPLYTAQDVYNQSASSTFRKNLVAYISRRCKAKDHQILAALRAAGCLP